jgi:hypothetical protein
MPLRSDHSARKVVCTFCRKGGIPGAMFWGSQLKLIKRNLTSDYSFPGFRRIADCSGHHRN